MNDVITGHTAIRWCALPGRHGLILDFSDTVDRHMIR